MNKGQKRQSGKGQKQLNMTKKWSGAVMDGKYRGTNREGAGMVREGTGRKSKDKE